LLSGLAAFAEVYLTKAHPDRQIWPANCSPKQRQHKEGYDHRKSDSRAKERFKEYLTENIERRAEKSTQVSLLLSRWILR
jgi:frataxin-like iron-binding protein CyaY